MNILVIDDEPLIHKSIEKLIHTYCENIHVFHAYNGHEMLDLIQEHNFLLAFVDIKMPGLSGLEAIGQAKEISPMTRYYIMTGFNEFEYAKQAIKLKVDDYLMKPLDLKTIQETIESAKELNQCNKRERKTIFRNWLESTLNHREGSLQQYTDYYCSLILVSIDTPSFPKEALLEKLIAYNDIFVSTFTGNQLLLLCFSEDATILRNLIRDLSNQSYQDGITLFNSSIIRKPAELKAALHKLIHYSSLRVLLGIEKFYSLKPLQDYDPDLIHFCNICLSWKRAYNERNYNEFTKQSEFICTQLENQEVWTKYWENISRFFLLSLNTATPLPDSPVELGKYFYEYAKQLLQSSESEHLIHSIIQFIQDHYCDNNLTVTILSERFGLSANYISTLLKQELGIRYNDYITQLRLIHAKELLISTKKSVKDITSACGYYSQSHFTKLFIDKEKCTPIEYRKKHTI